jgi:hypothetical protein
MKLYFKQPITDADRLKFLEYCCNNNGCQASLVFDDYQKDILNGYYETDIDNKSAIDELKALDIWQEQKKFGKFKDFDSCYITYGYLGKSDANGYQKIDENGNEGSKYDTFEEITDLKELL